jgi:carbonic anhydrase
MKNLNDLIENNRVWAAGIKASDAEFFQRLALQQTPAYLWIGCSDSRVPSSTLVGLSPGEMFVHRNVANVVVHTDLNCLSVIQYAVEALAVKHIIVCGHYGCGGVRAALANSTLGLIDNWLRHVQDVRQKHARLLEQASDDERRLQQLCELNVIEQVVNVCQTTIVQQAWARGQELSVHGWIYGLEDGLLRDLKMGVTGRDEVAESFKAAVAAASHRQDA